MSALNLPSAADLFVARYAKDGTLLDQGGLLPTATGALVRVSDGKVNRRRRSLHRGQGGDRRLRDVAGMHEGGGGGRGARRFMELHADLWPGYEGVRGPQGHGPGGLRATAAVGQGGAEDLALPPAPTHHVHHPTRAITKRRHVDAS